MPVLAEFCVLKPTKYRGKGAAVTDDGIGAAILSYTVVAVFIRVLCVVRISWNGSKFYETIDVSRLHARLPPMEKLDFLGIQIGTAGSLDAKALQQAVTNTLIVIGTLSPLTGISVAVGGYDDDPREIFEIVEAREYVLDFFAGIIQAGVPIDRFLPDTIHLVELCYAAEKGMEIVLHKDITDLDIIRHLEEYQERVRQKM